MKQKKDLVVRAADFSLIVEHLYKMIPDEVLHRYIPEHEQQSILKKAHAGVARAHYVGKANLQKILRARLWWPTVHKDAKELCQACDVSKRT